MAGRNGTHRRIWLHLLKEGGRWTVPQLADSLALANGSVNTAAHRMVEYGMVRNTGGHRKAAFGVTKACKIPQGVTVEDMTALGVIAVAEDEARS